MKKILAILMLSASFFGDAQEFLSTKLSSKFDIKISIKKTGDNRSGFSDCIITIGIINKTSKKVQSIAAQGSIFESSFSNIKTTRSYTTGFNKDVKVVDNDYGDVVVADFNFDGKEDIAVKRDEGGNGGPLYNYYLQDNKGVFKIDTYLSETMIFFPTEIDAKKKTLMTLVHANAYQMSETTYKLDSKTWKWKEIKQRLVE